MNRLAVPPNDFLDSMMWSIGASAVLLGIAAIKLLPQSSTDSLAENGKGLRGGLSIALAANGVYLFLSGMMFNYLWPLRETAGGSYDVLFGGSSALAGLVLLATAAALWYNQGLKGISYFATVIGIFLIVDAISILNYGLTRDPQFSAILFLAPAITSFLSIPATHSDNKVFRWIFAIAAFLFALAWIFMAAETTHGHLEPPPPSS